MKHVRIETSFDAKEEKKMLTAFGLCWKYSRILNRNDKNNQDNKRSKAPAVARTTGISKRFIIVNTNINYVKICCNNDINIICHI